MKPSLRCESCNIGFATSTTLLRHQNVIHKALLPVSCPVCKARFRDNYSYQKHFAVHQDTLSEKGLNTQRPKKRRLELFDCFLCDREFDITRYKEHMKNHMKKIREEGEELRNLVDGFGETCERITATMGSFMILGQMQGTLPPPPPIPPPNIEEENEVSQDNQ